MFSQVWVLDNDECFLKMQLNFGLQQYIIRKCMYVYGCLHTFYDNYVFFSFLVPLEPLGLII